jgi:hypothetical protein
MSDQNGKQVWIDTYRRILGLFLLKPNPFTCLQNITKGRLMEVCVLTLRVQVVSNGITLLRV